MTLRKLESTDTPWVVKWRNDNRHWFGDSSELTTQGHRHWFHETYMQDPGDHMYMVVNKEGAGVGTIGIKLPSFEIQRVLLGDRNSAESGLMGTALAELIRLYRSDVYWLRVLRNNDRAIAFYQKHDFQQIQIQGEFLLMRRKEVWL